MLRPLLRSRESIVFLYVSAQQALHQLRFSRRGLNFLRGFPRIVQPGQKFIQVLQEGSINGPLTKHP